MKIFQIEQDGFVWQFPARLIAEDRARHYQDDPDSSYEEEFEYTMDSKFELTEWFFNNMNWSDVSDRATLVSRPSDPPEPDMNDDLETEIIEIEDEDS